MLSLDELLNLKSFRDDGADADEKITFLCNNDDIMEEIERISFICSCIIDAIKSGGSVLIPIGRPGAILLLLELISETLHSSSIKVIAALAIMLCISCYNIVAFNEFCMSLSSQGLCSRLAFMWVVS
jgi:hypothetical protein